MAAQSDINTLLRFLTQSVKLPLPSAFAAAKNLQTKSLISSSLIATSDLATLTPLFASQEDAKKALNAAKRAAKRPAGSENQPSPRKKRRLSLGGPSEPEPHELEASLALPDPVFVQETLSSIVLFTNRAPLLLIFCLTLLEYTMPRQPLSSRLSLAQAQVSQGAKERAKELRIEKGETASSEGWGVGQPTVKVMNKDVPVVRRVGYPLASPKAAENEQIVKHKSSTDMSLPSQEPEILHTDSTETEQQSANDTEETGSAYWALDLEALKKSTTDVVFSTTTKTGGGLPIYSPHSARAYIIEAFASATPDRSENQTSIDEKKGAKPKKPKSEAKQKEENLGMLLGALKLLFDSWSHLESDELSRRAWGFYVNVRPEVAHGASGWGNKGEVVLRKILDLRR